MKILPYQTQYKAQCLAVFKSNMPKYFLDEEYPLFEKWLDDKALDGRYFVVLQHDAVVACGGYFYDKRYLKCGLSWGMVDAALHGQGIGKLLTAYRIDKMKAEFPTEGYMIVTSQHTAAFYEKMGFVIHKVTPDGFGKGLDEYYMELV